MAARVGPPRATAGCLGRWGRGRDVWGVVVVVAGVLLLAGVAFALSAPRVVGGGAVAHRGVLARHPVSARLPLAAEGPVSRIVGRDERAYRVVPGGAGFVVGNPGQRLGARFDRRGVVIRSGRARLALGLSGYGYGRALRAAGAVAPVAQANRVMYRRGPLVEWYANGPLGLEQGFSLAARPGTAGGGLLTLSLAVSGNVRGALAPGGGAVSFTGPRASLSYRGLVATDARGRLLPARIELRPGGLLLRIDDRRARYPLRIDPFIQQAKLTASDGTVANQFGNSVAVSGDTVVVGQCACYGGNAAAYVFVKPADGWANATEAAKLTPKEHLGGGTFGYSVAISGDTVVVGEPGLTFEISFVPGAAYVFVKPPGGWKSETDQAVLTASDSDPMDNNGFGAAVAVSGDTVAAGAPNANVTVNGSVHQHQGATYVFDKPADGWASETETAKLTASDGGNPGEPVAFSGDAIVAGSYVFDRPAGGWASETETAKLTTSDGANIYPCAVYGDTVVGRRDSGAPGALYVFRKHVGGWANETEQAVLTASDGANLAGPCAVSGDMVVAGVSGATVNGQADEGAAYEFVKPAGGWASETETAKLTASDGVGGDELGYAVAVSGNTAVVGAPTPVLFGRPRGVPPGAAYVFGPTEPRRPACGFGHVRARRDCSARKDPAKADPRLPSALG